MILEHAIPLKGTLTLSDSPAGHPSPEALNPPFLSLDLLFVEILRYRSMYDGLRSFAAGVLIWPYLCYGGLSLLQSFWSPCVTLSYLIRPFTSGQTLGSIML